MLSCKSTMMLSKMENHYNILNGIFVEYFVNWLYKNDFKLSNK